MTRPHRPLGWFALAALWLAMLALRQNPWVWRDGHLVFGVVPIGLAYQVGYSILASGVMLVLVRRMPIPDDPAGEPRASRGADPRA